jgi:hypothetical protein
MAMDVGGEPLLCTSVRGLVQWLIRSSQQRLVHAVGSSHLFLPPDALTDGLHSSSAVPLSIVGFMASTNGYIAGDMVYRLRSWEVPS